MRVIQPETTSARLWTGAQVAGIGLTVLLLGGLFTMPEISLRLLWNAVIPLVPVSLLAAPLLWRNVCPLASLSLVGTGQRSLSAGQTRIAGIVGIALLMTLVPARRVLFNTDATALAVTIIAVAVLALLSGWFFDLKAGFCNAICPVLPVERLYGQRPMASLANARCPACTRCTPACLDLSPTKSVAQTLGPARRSVRWVGQPFGVFAAAFPGFVLGYFLVSDGPLATTGIVYGTVLVWAAVSFVVTSLVVVAFRLEAGRVLPTLGALAAGAYYWFGADAVVTAWGGGEPVITAVRLATLSLIVVWWWRTL